MRFLLDTETWVWLLESPDKLSSAAAEVINAPDAGVLGVSEVSAWELARKEALGQLQLSMASRVWLKKATQVAGIRMLRLSAEICWESCHLPGDNSPTDPVDQVIVATARLEGMTLITRDQKLLDYPEVRTLW